MSGKGLTYLTLPTASTGQLSLHPGDAGREGRDHN